MYWIDNNTGIPTPPIPPAVISASKRYFTNGGGGVPPTIPEDFWFHMVQEELLGVLTLAGVTPDKSDLNQVAKAIQNIAFSAYPVGAPIPWPTAVPPTGFIAMTGQSFSGVAYPKLALAYPALVLPDMRAEFIRGWDAGRGIDPGRTLLSPQTDAMRNLTGYVSMDLNGMGWVDPTTVAGVFSVGPSVPNTYKPNPGTFTTVTGDGSITFDASKVVPVASEFRTRSMAMYYIVRAA